MRAQLEREGKNIPELKQVWFPGVHINSGGGADDCITDMKGDLESTYKHLTPTSYPYSSQIYQRHLGSGCSNASLPISQSIKTPSKPSSHSTNASLRASATPAHITTLHGLTKSSQISQTYPSSIQNRTLFFPPNAIQSMITPNSTTAGVLDLSSIHIPACTTLAPVSHVCQAS